MTPHLHIGLAEFMVVSAYIILFGALWRLLALRLGDRPISRAMLLIY
jgi:hypothetical protein